MEEKQTPDSQTVVEFEDRKRLNGSAFLVWVTFIISVVFAGFLWVSTSGLKNTISNKTDEKNNLISEIGSSKYTGVEDKANSINDAVTTLTSISNEKISTSKLLGGLYGYMTTDVKVTSLVISGDNSMSLDGATASYRQVADFVVALKSNKRISKVTLNSISVSDDGSTSANENVTFTVTGKIDRSSESSSSSSDSTIEVN